MRKVRLIIIGLLCIVLSVLGVIYWGPQLLAGVIAVPNLSTEYIAQTDKMAKAAIFWLIGCLILFVGGLVMFIFGLVSKNERK